MNPLAAGNREILKAQVLLAVFMFAGDGVVLSTLTLLLKERLGNIVPFFGTLVGVATFSGSLFAARSVVAALVSPLAGRLADRFGRKPVLVVSMLLSVASYLLMAFASTATGLIASAVLTAFSGGAIMVILMAHIGDHAHSERTGAAMGQFAMMGDIGSSIGPALAFSLIPVIGITWVYVISAILFACSSLAAALPLRAKKPLGAVST